MNEMVESWRRVYAIANNTLTESLRQKSLYVLFVSGTALVVASFYFTQFAFFEEFKFLKDLGYAAISWTGLLMALMGASQLIPAEIERRTIYTIMSKPVRPFEFVVGKYMGLIALMTLMVVILSVLFYGVLRFKEADQIRSNFGNVSIEKLDDTQKYTLSRIHHEAQDPRLFQAVILVWAKLSIVAAMSVMLSTIATSTVFIVAMTSLIYLIGHLYPIARDVWHSSQAGATVWQESMLRVVGTVVPDFYNYSLIDEIIAGNVVHWGQTITLLGYSLVYIGILLAAGSLLFTSREL